MNLKPARHLPLRRILLTAATFGVAACTGEALGSSNAERLQASSRSREAQANLNAMYSAQKSYREVKGSYSENLKQIGFVPERGNRYAYFAAAKGEVQHRRSATLPALAAFSIVAADEHAHPGIAVPTSLKEANCPLTLGAEGKTVGLGVSGEGADQQFIGYAIGNVDDDGDFDCWSVATFDRKAKSGETIPAGKLLHEKSDFEK